MPLLAFSQRRSAAVVMLSSAQAQVRVSSRSTVLQAAIISFCSAESPALHARHCTALQTCQARYYLYDTTVADHAAII